MKRTILTGMLFVFIPMSLYGFQAWCGSPSIEQASPELALQTPYPDLSTVEWVDIAVVFHIIRKSDGTLGYTGDLNFIISEFNTAFAGARMRFFLKSINYIDSDTYWAMTYASEDDEDYLAESFNDGFAVNIYFIPNYGGSLPAKGTPTQDLMDEMGVNRQFPSIIVKNDLPIHATTTHEMGHYFNLLHTWHRFQGVAECPDGSNSLTAGDLVQETAAEPLDHNGTNFHSNLSVLHSRSACVFV